MVFDFIQGHIFILPKFVNTILTAQDYPKWTTAFHGLLELTSIEKGRGLWGFLGEVVSLDESKGGRSRYKLGEFWIRWFCHVMRMGEEGKWVRGRPTQDFWTPVKPTPDHLQRAVSGPPPPALRGDLGPGDLSSVPPPPVCRREQVNFRGVLGQPVGAEPTPRSSIVNRSLFHTFLSFML